ncbi:MAG: hypothetical protein IBJ12_01555 [Sphingomonadaceae bacterium]|nr:hypothetical protein [Sphingomonadaceae bacterium]
MTQTFELPAEIKELVAARNNLRTYYASYFERSGVELKLSFTLDGNLIGDLGEALAVKLFGIRLADARSTEGIDGIAPDGETTVQVKVTGTGRGPAFRQTETRADHLLFFDLDFENCTGSVVFNGPEHYATSYLPASFKNQRSVSRAQIRLADSKVPDSERLPMLIPSP